MHPGCNKSFNTHGNLKSHSHNHVEFKEFTCTFEGCTKTYNKKNRFDIHLRTHVGFKPFKCEFPGCSKTFNENGNLRTHMRSHSGDKPYKCIEIGCKASFKFSINLKYHLKSHKKNNQSFYCIYCPMTFTRYNTLQTHIEIHREEESKPSCQNSLQHKRAKTAEDLIQEIHPRQSKSSKIKLQAQDIKINRTNKITGTDNKSSLSDLCEIKEDDTDNIYEETLETESSIDYYDFQSNLSMLFRFTKQNFKSNKELPTTFLNLKLQLGTLLQDHQDRVLTFRNASLDPSDAAI